MTSGQNMLKLTALCLMLMCHRGAGEFFSIPERIVPGKSDKLTLNCSPLSSSRGRGPVLAILIRKSNGQPVNQQGSSQFGGYGGGEAFASVQPASPSDQQQEGQQQQGQPQLGQSQQGQSQLGQSQLGQSQLGQQQLGQQQLDQSNLGQPPLHSRYHRSRSRHRRAARAHRSPEFQYSSLTGSGVTTVPNDNRVEVSGSLTEPPHLSLVLHAPGQADLGEYECQMTYMGQGGRVDIVRQTRTVTEAMELSVKSLDGRVHAVEAQMEAFVGIGKSLQGESQREREKVSMLEEEVAALKKENKEMMDSLASVNAEVKILNDKMKEMTEQHGDLVKSNEEQKKKKEEESKASDKAASEQKQPPPPPPPPTDHNYNNGYNQGNGYHGNGQGPPQQPPPHNGGYGGRGGGGAGGGYHGNGQGIPMGNNGGGYPGNNAGYNGQFPQYQNNRGGYPGYGGAGYGPFGNGGGQGGFGGGQGGYGGGWQEYPGGPGGGGYQGQPGRGGGGAPVYGGGRGGPGVEQDLFAVNTRMEEVDNTRIHVLEERVDELKDAVMQLEDHLDALAIAVNYTVDERISTLEGMNWQGMQETLNVMEIQVLPMIAANITDLQTNVQALQGLRRLTDDQIMFLLRLASEGSVPNAGVEEVQESSGAVPVSSNEPQQEGGEEGSEVAESDVIAPEGPTSPGPSNGGGGEEEEVQEGQSSTTVANVYDQPEQSEGRTEEEKPEGQADGESEGGGEEGGDGKDGGVGGEEEGEEKGADVAGEESEASSSEEEGEKEGNGAEEDERATRSDAAESQNAEAEKAGVEATKAPARDPPGVRICYVCGNNATGEECTRSTNKHTQACPAHLQTCLTDVIQDGHRRNIFRRCGTIEECKATSAASDPACLTDNFMTAHKMECHFCCTSSRCNDGIIPTKNFYNRG
ncbi:uncharacterized protein LOC101845242 [Aplysia californica]|uniref:Uncharacterized protein LOC101845242 n=1 Tax=Aplysia californica TaxID=6500 RepID=A0ABM1VU17_APLCA|nr:uncharacterized protein LOC101845242 [Aplysia californica]